MTDRTPTGDLRERLGEALYQWTLNAAGASRTSPPVHPRTLENLRASSRARADAVLPVVEAATAALRERAEEAERQRHEALAAVQRVRDLCARGPGPANEYQIWTVDVLAALDQPEEPPPVEHTGGNAEDCPVCRPRIDQPRGVLYPWHCTGPNPKDPA